MGPITPTMTRVVFSPWKIIFSHTLLTQDTPSSKTHLRSSLFQEIACELLGLGALPLHSYNSQKAMNADVLNFYFQLRC